MKYPPQSSSHSPSVVGSWDGWSRVLHSWLPIITGTSPMCHGGSRSTCTGASFSRQVRVASTSSRAAYVRLRCRASFGSSGVPRMSFRTGRASRTLSNAYPSVHPSPATSTSGNSPMIVEMKLVQNRSNDSVWCATSPRLRSAHWYTLQPADRTASAPSILRDCALCD